MKHKSRNKPASKERYPGYNKEVAAREDKARALGAASANPLPGPLDKAFDLDREVAGLRVRKFCHYDWVILRRINSPWMRQLDAARAAKPGEKPTTEWTDEDAYQIIYILTRPCREVAKWFDSQRADQAAANFRDLARESIGFILGPVEVGLLVELIGLALNNASATALQYAPKESGATVNFPKPPAARATEAGG